MMILKEIRAYSLGSGLRSTLRGGISNRVKEATSLLALLFLLMSDAMKIGGVVVLAVIAIVVIVLIRSIGGPKAGNTIKF